MNTDDSTPTTEPEVLPARAPSRALVIGLLLLITCLGAWLRLWHLGNESLWFDEVSTYRCLDEPNLVAYLREFRAGEPAPFMPVYPTTQYLWGRCFGTTVYATRLLAVTLGILSVLLAFSLGKRFYGSTAGLVAAFCLALSMGHIAFSQEIKYYALQIFLVMISVYTFVVALDKRTTFWWVLNALVNTVLLWEHMFSGFLFAVPSLYLLFFHWKDRRLWLTWIGYHALLVPLMGLWIYTTLDRTPTETGVPAWKAAIAFFPTPHLPDLINTFVVFAGGRFSNVNPSEQLPIPVSLEPVLVLLLAALIGALGIKAARQALASVRVSAGAAPDAGRRQKGAGEMGPFKTYVLLITWAVLPTLLLFATSRILRPCFLHRYVFYSAPAIYLLAGGAVVSLNPRWARAAATALLLFLFAYHATAMVAGPFRPDYRGASQYITAHGRDHDGVIVFKSINARGFDYNTDLPDERRYEFDYIEGVHAAIIEHTTPDRDTWVLFWRWDALPQFEAWAHEHGYTPTQIRIGGRPPVYLYRIQQTP